MKHFLDTMSFLEMTRRFDEIILRISHSEKSHSKKVKIQRPLKKSENILLLEKEFTLFRVNFPLRRSEISLHKINEILL